MAMPSTIWQPHVGDRVMLRGTHVLGEVKRVDGSGGHDRVMLKVGSVLGKSPGSKAARAWKGAWVTCTPGMLVPHPWTTN